MKIGRDHARHALCLLVAFLALACTASPAVPSAAPSSPSPSPIAASSPAQNGGAVAARSVPNGSIAGVDDATWALVDRLGAPTYTADTTAAMTAALARAGVATFADPSSQSPEVPVSGVASPFQLLGFQTHALAVGVWAGTTWSGAELDSLLPLQDAGAGLAPTSAVLAGYVAAVDTPGAAFARALMAGQDLLNPSTVEFPGVVLVLFASDVATDGSSTSAPSLGPSPAAMDDSRLLALAQTGPNAAPLADSAYAAVTGPCSTAANFIHGMITSLFDKLKLAAQSNIVLAVVAAIWNWIVDKLQKFVEGIITSVTGLVFGYVRAIAASISTVADQIASVLPFSVAVAVTGPTGDVFDLTSGAGSMQGSYVVSVTAGDLPSWPDVLQDCANVAGIQLPDFHSKNVPMTWGPLEILAPGDPLLAPVPVDPTDAVTDASGHATWTFRTSADPGDSTGPVETQADIMHVTVHRPELDKIRAALTNALLGFIPPILQSTVLYLIGKLNPAIAGIQTSLNALLDRPGEAAAVIRFHGKNPPTPAPASQTPVLSTACTTSAPAGKYSGTLTTDSVTDVPPGEIDLGESGTTTDHGTGPVTITVAPDGSLSGTFEEAITETEEFRGLAVGSRTTTLDLVGAGISGTLCTMTMTFASETQTACQTTIASLSCDNNGQPISLTGLVPPLPMGAPTPSAGALTWTIDSASGFDAGFGGLSSNVTSTINVTIGVP